MSQRIINFLIYLTVFCLPLYLVRFKIGWIPTNFLELLIVVLFVFWFWRFWKLGFHWKPSFHEYILPIFLIFLGLTISTWFSDNLEVSAGIWKSWFIIPLLFFMVVINHIKTKEQVRNIIISLALSGLGVVLLSNNLTYDGRLTGFFLSPNHLAMYLSPILILSLYLYSQAKERIFKILLITYYLLLITIIYLTYSYGAWLGLLAGLFFLLIIKKDKKLILIGLSLIILVLVLQIPSQKFQGIVDLSYPSLESRLIIWQSSWQILKDNTLIGIGPGMFQEYYLAYQDKMAPYPEWAVPQPHNLFLAFWLQAGLLGLIGFIWLLIYFFKKTDPNHVLGSVLIASMIYLLVHGLIDTTYWKNDLALIFWLITGLGYIRSRLFD